MREVNGLCVAFVEAHPREAAGALEGLATEDSAAFLGTLAPRLAAGVLQHMNPPYGARLLARLDEERVAAIVAVMGAQPAAQVFRHLSAARQAGLLARLPVAAALAVRLLTGFPKGACGALMDPWPLALAPETAAAEALERARRFDGELDDCLFVADGGRRLLGVVALDKLLRAAPGAPLAAIMRSPEHFVSPLASLPAVAGHPGWNSYHVLPVVERDNRLAGALHRRALLAALGGPSGKGGPDLAAGVAGAYWETLLGLARLALTALPPVKQVDKAGRQDGS